MSITTHLHEDLPLVVLLGRPNVGKSTLFNRLIRSNRAITHDRPGVTRDRMEGVVRSRGKQSYAIMDTGGVNLDSHARVEEGPEGIRGFEADILDQAKEAVTGASLLCLVVDAKDGLTPFDQHLAAYFRKEGKPLLLVVNKVDGPERAELLSSEFHSLGLPLLFCSAAHGYNIRELEYEIRQYLFDDVDDETPEDREEEARKKRRERLHKKDSALPEFKEKGIGPAVSRAGVNTPGNADIMDDTDIAGDGGEFLSEVSPGAEPDGAEKSAEREEDNSPLRLALLGRPNAGKSSLVNALVGRNRMIVSNVAGTTRDSVDVAAVIDGEPYVFVDTAGVRRRSKITDVVERYSVNSSIKSTTKAHVTLLVLDAEEGLTLQDKRLIDLLDERKTPFMVVVNKWDLIPGEKRKPLERDFKEALQFCKHVPLVFISALKKKNLAKIIPIAGAIRKECGVRVTTGTLNRALEHMLSAHQPPIVKRVRPKFYYLTQAEINPPTFVFFVNKADYVAVSFARYLEKTLRQHLNIKHAPMRIHFRSSHKTKERKR